MKTLKTEIESIIDYLDFHKDKNKHFAFVTKDSNNRRKLLAGATFINEIKCHLQNALILCGDIEK
jgi:hypothetical protein